MFFSCNYVLFLFFLFSRLIKIWLNVLPAFGEKKTFPKLAYDSVPFLSSKNSNDGHVTVTYAQLSLASSLPQSKRSMNQIVGKQKSFSALYFLLLQIKSVPGWFFRMLVETSKSEK